VRTLEDRIVGVGRMMLTNERQGLIDFATCMSVVPPAASYVLRLESGSVLSAELSGAGARLRLVLV
jgi:hypothetical protein